MDLEAGDEVISMSVIDHVEVTTEERDEYLRVHAMRRRRRARTSRPSRRSANEAGERLTSSPERYAELAAKEQLLLTVTRNGFGKRTSAYEYRVTNRAARGPSTSRPRPATAASPPPSRWPSPIRSCWSPTRARRSAPGDDIRIAGRNTQGVKLFIPTRTSTGLRGPAGGLRSRARRRSTLPEPEVGKRHAKNASPAPRRNAMRREVAMAGHASGSTRTFDPIHGGHPDVIRRRPP